MVACLRESKGGNPSTSTCVCAYLMCNCQIAQYAFVMWQCHTTFQFVLINLTLLHVATFRVVNEWSSHIGRVRKENQH